MGYARRRRVRPRARVGARPRAPRRRSCSTPRPDGRAASRRRTRSRRASSTASEQRGADAGDGRRRCSGCRAGAAAAARRRASSRRCSAADAGALVEVAAADPLDGPGVIVRVRQAQDAVLPGVRAFMVVQRAGAKRSATSPRCAAAAPPRSRRRSTRAVASRGRRGRHVRSAGDDRRRRGGRPATWRARESRAAAESRRRRRPRRRARRGRGRARHVRIDLARLDALMNLIGELVITRGRLLAAHGGCARSGARRGDADARRASSPTCRPRS